MRRRLLLALLLSLVLLPLDPPNAHGVKPIVNSRAVQALAWHYISTIDPWQLDEAWLGKCVRHGRNFVECRIWAVWAHRLEDGSGRSVYRCHEWLSVEGFPEDMSVRVTYPDWALNRCEHWVESYPLTTVTY